MIRLEDLSVKYESTTVIDRLTHTFPEGKISCIIGESGVGKTSLLNVIAGLLPASCGRATVEAERISYVFQDPTLFPWMTSLENVSTLCSRERATDVLTALKLSDSLHKYPSELSGGMKQRVSLARALGYDGDIYLLDEPFGALDAELHDHVAKTFLDSVRGKTVIMVTHDERDIALADKVFKLTKAPNSRLEEL